MSWTKRTHLWRLATAILALSLGGSWVEQSVGAEKHDWFSSIVYFNKDRIAGYSADQIRVVVYLHGRGGESEAPYDQMLRQLVDQTGCVVVFPKFDSQTPVELGWLASTYRNAKAATERALFEVDWLMWFQGVTTGLQNFGEQPVLAGHSLGGLYALKMTDDFGSAGVNVPTALIMHDPSGLNSGPALGSLSNIPANTLMIVMVSNQVWQSETSATFGYSDASGVWRAAWDSNVGSSYKHAFLAPGDHDGMKGAKFASTGQPYLNSLATGCTLNYAWPVSWWNGELSGTTRVTGWFNAYF